MEEKCVLKDLYVVTTGAVYQVSYKGSNAIIIWRIKKEEGKIIENKEKRIPENAPCAGINQRIGISKEYLSIYNGPIKNKEIPRPEDIYLSDFIWKSPSAIKGLFLEEGKALEYFVDQSSKKTLLSETKKAIKATGSRHYKFVLSLKNPIVSNIEEILQ